MGPTKVIIKNEALYDAKTGKLIQDGLKTHKEIEDFAKHRYITLPVVDKQCRPWLLDEQPIYCLRGSRYETMDDKVVHLARCPDCEGWASVMTKLWSNRIASGVSPAGTSLIRGLK